MLIPEHSHFLWVFNVVGTFISPFFFHSRKFTKLLFWYVHHSSQTKPKTKTKKQKTKNKNKIKQNKTKNVFFESFNKAWLRHLKSEQYLTVWIKSYIFFLAVITGHLKILTAILVYQLELSALMEESWKHFSLEQWPWFTLNTPHNQYFEGNLLQTTYC